MIVNGVNGVLMAKFHSQAVPGLLCHMCCSTDAGYYGRSDLVDPEERLQVAILQFEKGKLFQPHIHLKRERPILVTQEAWVVLKGSVKVRYFDLDKNHIADVVLSAGDISMTFRGGHGYEMLEDSEVVEFKLGQFAAEGDKEYIG